MKRTLLSTLALLAAYGPATAHEGHDHHAAPAALTSGIETRNFDTTVRPQDDFFQYLNGEWLRTTQIPEEKSSWGSFAKLRDDTLPQLRGIIDELKTRKHKAGSNEQRIADLYASFMNEAQVEQQGIKPLSGELGQIRGVRDKKALPGLIARLTRIGVPTPYVVHVAQDARESTKYAAHVAQSGLGLPDRDYYLKQEDERLAGIRTKYVAHVAQLLKLAGHKTPEAAAQAILEFETALAEAQWSKVDNRNPVKTYNKTPIAQLGELAPGYDWLEVMGRAGVATKTDYVIVTQPSYLTAFARLVDHTPLDTLKAYFEWQLLREMSPYLSKPYADASFAFYEGVVSGVTAQAPRWKRGVAVVEVAIGEGLGQLYVTQYFPAERKARMDALVKNLLAAYQTSIEQLDWMGPETRREAQAKLAKFTTKIGYPDKWRDYSGLSIVPGDLTGNLRRAAEFAYKRNIAKLGTPVDRAEWSMTPQTVNAYYNARKNEIVFPAAILQPPFFNMEADDAANYGAIGAIIGHEISHGFDDKGSQSDGDGNLRDWWSRDDRLKFKAKADALTKQYGAYSPLPGYLVNGELTLGENIADNSGVAIAYKAYKLSLNGQPAPVIDGMTGEQRFYMGFGQVWRTKMRIEQQIKQVKTDPHAPGQFRTNGTVVNQPGFYDAFGVKEGDKLYVAPENRIIIW